MAPTESPDAKASRLMAILEPHLRRLLRDAPEFGSVRVEAWMRDSDIGRVEVGTSVSRIIAPRADRGEAR
jgi:hypothetical protein